MTKSRPKHWLGLIVTITVAALWANHTYAEAPMGQYIISDGTVFDTQSQLTWEQFTSLDIYTWEEAQSHCQNLELDGSGWRAPSIKELQTLIDETRSDPAIDTKTFPFTAVTRYWTSTTRASNMSQAWLVSFGRGGTIIEDIKNPHPVRCVR